MAALTFILAAAATPPTTPWFTIVTAIVALGGLAAAIFKIRPENDSLAAQASKAAVEVFNASVENLQNDLREARTEIKELEIAQKAIEDRHRGRLNTVLRERDNALELTRILTNQISHLTDDIATLNRKIERIEIEQKEH